MLHDFYLQSVCSLTFRTPFPVEGNDIEDEKVRERNEWWGRKFVILGRHGTGMFFAVQFVRCHSTCFRKRVVKDSGKDEEEGGEEEIYECEWINRREVAK